MGLPAGEAPSARYLKLVKIARLMPVAQEAAQRLRAREGITQTQLATRLYTSQAVISMVERAKPGVSLRMLLAVVAADRDSAARFTQVAQ